MTQSKHDPEVVYYYLLHYGYKTVEEWAANSDYRYNKTTDTWLNDDAQPVDIVAELDRVIDESEANYE